LVTIMIISILAAAVLGVAAVAGETARESKTRTIISRIHTLLMQQYDTYTTRRVKVRPEILNDIRNQTASTALKGRLKAEARLYALRELMLMEVPDRWSDVLLNQVTSSFVPLAPIYLDVTNTNNQRTELASLYLRTLRRIAASDNKITGDPNTLEEILANQGAECLYLVVMNACGDGESRTLFPESSIADTDGDGAPEFIDGWGHPIEFLRWAPGFESDIQTSAVALDSDATPTQAWSAAGSGDHDPFDLYRAHPMAFRLVPLVYSAGRDEEFGVQTSPGAVTWRPASGTVSFSPTLPLVRPPLDPFVKHPAVPSGTAYFGTEDGTKTATDNIHNHLIGTR